jgi:Na+/H+ antiporter NhaD/arsenite permease-like protein
MMHSIPSLLAEAGPVSTWVTVLFASILITMIGCLAFEEKLHAKKSVIVGLFAVISLLLGTAVGVLDASIESVRHLPIGGHDISLPVYIPAIDWGVIAIILGSSLFVDVTSKSGLFTWIAIRLTKASGGDPRRLLWFYGLMTVVFSAVLNNVTAMIIVGSLTGVSLKRLGRMDKLLAFLLIEALLTDVGGLLTLISSVPNIIVGRAADISFLSFFLKASGYVTVATVATIWMGAKLFRIDALRDDVEREQAAEQVAGFDENDGVESTGFFWFGAGMLGLFIIAIASASVPGWVLSDLGMGYVAMAFGAVMLVRYKAVADQFYKALDWDLLAFFAGLFVVINVMEHAGVLAAIGEGLEPILSMGKRTGSAALLLSSAAASSVTDNIPLAAMLSKILAVNPNVVPADMASNPSSPFWWALVFGANLGGNLTPIGSASTLVAVTITHKLGVEMSFLKFIKMALPFAVMQLALAVVYVLLIIPLFG